MVKNLPAIGRPRFDPWVRKSPWRREWLPTPVFLPGEFHRQRSLAGCSPWGRKELDMTERLTLRFCSAFRAPSGNWDADSIFRSPQSYFVPSRGKTGFKHIDLGRIIATVVWSDSHSAATVMALRQC